MADQADRTSDSTLPPTLPKPNEAKRPKPLERYMTQQLTTMVENVETASDDGSSANNPSWRRWLDSLRRRWQQASRQLRLGIVGASVLAFVVLILGVTAGGASSSAALEPESPESPGPFESQVFVQHPSVIEWVDSQRTRWSDADLSPGEFAAVTPRGLDDAECFSGAMSAIETTLCEFSTAQAASVAKPAAESLVGKNTGVVVQTGTRLLVVTDRHHADPSGRTINAIVKTFVP